MPAADAPPLATPYGQVPRKAPQQLDLVGADQASCQPASSRLQDVATTVERRMDFRSPGTFNLREVFDIGYAIHRQEEEGKRRRNRQQGARNDRPLTGFQSALGSRKEDYHDESDYPPQAEGTSDRSPNEVAKNSTRETGDLAGMEAKLRSTNLRTQSSATPERLPASQSRQQGYGQHNANVAAAAKHAINRKPNVAFELNLDKATLLEKRGARNPAQQVA